MDSGQYMCVFYRNQQKRYEKKGRRQFFGICLCILFAVSLIGGTFGEVTPVRAETTGAGTEETEKKEERHRENYFSQLTDSGMPGGIDRSGKRRFPDR